MDHGTDKRDHRHESGTLGPGAKEKPPAGAARRWLVALAPVVAVVLGLGACGRASPSSAARMATTVSFTNSVPAISRGTTKGRLLSGKPGSTGEPSQSEQLELAQCMRSHGVANFPDPSPEGGFLRALSAAGIDTHSPSYQRALHACKRYNPTEDMTPAQSAAEMAKALELSECMRSHGVLNFPDPSTGPVGEQVIDLRGRDIDVNSPTFQAASKACQKVVPGSK
jgi:hypothetical protein